MVGSRSAFWTPRFQIRAEFKLPPNRGQMKLHYPGQNVKNEQENSQCRDGKLRTRAQHETT
jgi:hypothetical protein